jgi:citronellol/citronellal dehydrogenase
MPYNSIYRRDLFREHIIVITGGGSGIGRCTAHELASLGAHVAIVGRNVAKLECVCGDIESDGGSISAPVADIRDERAVVATVERVLARRFLDTSVAAMIWLAEIGTGQANP